LKTFWTKIRTPISSFEIIFAIEAKTSTKLGHLLIFWCRIYKEAELFDDLSIVIDKIFVD